MTDERLGEVLRRAIASPSTDGPTRDLWPEVASRLEERRRWSFLDLGLAAAVAVALLAFPEWFWLLAYHL